MKTDMEQNTEIFEKHRTEGLNLTKSKINGHPGLLIYIDDSLQSVWSFEAGDAQVQQIYGILNPGKLVNVAEQVTRRS